MNTSTAAQPAKPKAIRKPRENTANISYDLQIETLNPSKMSEYQFERDAAIRAVISDEAKKKAVQDYFIHSEKHILSKSSESEELFSAVRKSIRILRNTVTEAEFSAIMRNDWDFREAVFGGSGVQSEIEVQEMRKTNGT
jgi:hypothetical protein